MVPRNRPTGITALSLFFVFGALISSLSAALLIWPGSRWDALWQVNPRAHAGFSAIGPGAVLAMLAVCAACLMAAIGLWRLSRWGYWIAACILALNLLGDIGNTVVMGDLRSLVGIPIAAALLAYLVSRRRLFTP